MVNDDLYWYHDQHTLYNPVKCSLLLRRHGVFAHRPKTIKQFPDLVMSFLFILTYVSLKLTPRLVEKTFKYFFSVICVYTLVRTASKNLPTFACYCPIYVCTQFSKDTGSVDQRIVYNTVIRCFGLCKYKHCVINNLLLISSKSTLSTEVCHSEQVYYDRKYVHVYQYSQCMQVYKMMFTFVGKVY